MTERAFNPRSGWTRKADGSDVMVVRDLLAKSLIRRMVERLEEARPQLMEGHKELLAEAKRYLDGYGYHGEPEQ